MTSKPWTRSDYHCFLHVVSLKTDVERIHYLHQTRDIVHRQIGLIYATIFHTLCAKWSTTLPHADRWVHWILSASGVHDSKQLHQLLWMDAELVIRYLPGSQHLPTERMSPLVQRFSQSIEPNEVSPDFLYAFTLRYYAPPWCTEAAPPSS
jgi:hypothetical protein